MQLNINIKKDGLNNKEIQELLDFLESLDSEDIIGILEGGHLGYGGSTINGAFITINRNGF
tara:strand:+ start:504 stop:686 length:183 start_codon:yes stop_codon:yes gene_type:complete